MTIDSQVTTSKGTVVQACQAYLGDVLGRPAESIDPAADFDQLGLDSALAVALLAELDEWYGVDIPPEELFENPTINAVAEYVEAHAQHSG